MNQINRFTALLMRSPILWGLLAAVGFYSLLHGGALGGFLGKDLEGYFRRYFAGHPIEYAEGTMFFLGLAALVLKLFDVGGQLTATDARLLGSVPAGGQTASDCDGLLAQLDALPARLQSSYLLRRLHAGLDHVRRRGSAEMLDEELKYLAESDAMRAHAGYSLVRIIVWAIPILGFLGTVMGITLAIANLSPQALEQSLPEVTAGLGIAFDTTAVALTQSIVLMFGMFLCERLESRLLARVDEQAGEELAGRFERSGTGGDPQVAAVRRIAETVLDASERLVERQALIWQATMDAAGERWMQTAAVLEQQLQQALSSALEGSLQVHAQELAAAAQSSTEQNLRQWAGVQESLSRGTEALAINQRELARHGDILRQVVEATGQVTRLEETLNRNLATLAGSQNFEETVQSLAAVIHLLNARLGQTPASTPHLGRNASHTAGHAA